MSRPNHSPTFIAGTPRSSGDVQTGEIPITRGGGRTACLWSGALAPSLAGAPAGALTSGGHTLLYSGAGRLNTVIPHAYLNSGQPVFFYDAGTISVSGISVSGQRIIGIVPLSMRATLAVLSGNTQASISWQDKIEIDMPFSSGLCVAAASGAPGFTCSFTPESNILDDGNVTGP